MPEYFAELKKRAAAVSQDENADVLVYTGGVYRPHDEYLIDLTQTRERRERVMFFITTYGGDADAAYRIARCLQRRYKHVTAVVPGFCKSAGTILILGAHDLVMFDHAELGPLDVQISKDDEVAERSSGLAPVQAFLSLDVQVRSALTFAISDLKSELQLTTRTAADVAGKLVGALYGGIYTQFDPLRLGEIQRAQAVSNQYGRRLIETSKIAGPGSLAMLVSGYPSHGFVIDREEASNLFPQKVRAPKPHEVAFAEHLLLRKPVDTGQKPLILYCDDEQGTNEQEDDIDHADAPNDAHPVDAQPGEAPPPGAGQGGDGVGEGGAGGEHVG